MIICPWKDIKKYASVLPGIEEAFDAVNALTEYENKKAYPLSDGNRFFVAVGTTKAPDVAEAHRKYLDIQYIVKGKEVMGWADLAGEPGRGHILRGVLIHGHQIFGKGHGLVVSQLPGDLHLTAHLAHQAFRVKFDHTASFTTIFTKSLGTSRWRPGMWASSGKAT